ncbi:MAG: hypothetical protein K0M52_09645 [Pseudomonas sp.]|nr:hypothetical protein [Pseudomonas sp.]
MKLTHIMLVGAILASTGCASGLNSYQKNELRHYEASGLMVEEKNPALGTALGLLPGGGSFYGREYGLGVVNLLFWPLSILWDPVSGHSAAETINYHATKHHVSKLENLEMDQLEDQLAQNQIDMTQYTLQKRKIESKYRYH